MTGLPKVLFGAHFFYLSFNFCVFQVGQVTRSHGSLDHLTRAPVRVHPVGAVDGLVRFLPLPLGPPVVLSTSHSHMVPNGLGPNSCRPKWLTTIQQI